jgi:CRP-like cAMP-binding protein
VISVIGLARLYIVHRYVTLSREQADVIARLVPGLKKDRARQMLRLGRFEEVPVGHILAVEGAPVRDLALLLAGQAQIERGSVQVALVGPGALVGELTFASGAPATATVRVSQEARVFLIERGVLLAYLARNPDVGSMMEQGIAGDLRAKLVRTTDRLSEHLTRTRPD